MCPKPQPGFCLKSFSFNTKSSGSTTRADLIKQKQLGKKLFFNKFFVQTFFLKKNLLLKQLVLIGILF